MNDVAPVSLEAPATDSDRALADALQEIGEHVVTVHDPQRMAALSHKIGALNRVAIDGVTPSELRAIVQRFVALVRR